MYRYILFDLDGTLVDSKEGIFNCIRYALDTMGVPVPEESILNCFIGPPLSWSFSTYFGMDDAQAARAVDAYREYYRAGGMLENSVYDGVTELLQKLNEAGVVCVVATSKPHIFANRILQHFSLDGYFSFVAGPELDGTRGEKSEVIAYALEQRGLSDRRSVLMIGDREHDVLGAKQFGMDSAGVLWGFGSEEELMRAGATYVCHHTDEVSALFFDDLSTKA